MEKTYQFKDVNMLQHGEMVSVEYKKIISAIKNKDESFFASLGFDFKWDFIQLLYSLQYDKDKMRSYQLYHDCGKHISQCISSDGKVHYPNHSFHSSELYGEFFSSEVAKELILKDLNFHTLKGVELIEWLEHESKQILASLYLTAWSELVANSTMFGGISSDSFKIKRKKLVKAGKKLTVILASIKNND